MDADYVSGKKSYPYPKSLIGVVFGLVSIFFKVPPVEPDLRLKEGDIIGDNLLVIYTPGHTPGSIALYDSKTKVIFVGDTLRFIKGKVEGPPMQFTCDSDSVKNQFKRFPNLILKRCSAVTGNLCFLQKPQT